jgi:ring-1,2-phenylacetyl-CoA epoxidase subunit PaaC
MHANTWVYQLAQGNQEANDRLQKALNDTWNYGLGIFEEGPYEDVLIESGIFGGEAELKSRWLELVTKLLEKAGLKVPAEDTWKPVNGGRTCNHTVHLQPLVEEMTEVYSIDPTADW